MRQLERNTYALVSGRITARRDANPEKFLNLLIAVAKVENEGSPSSCNFLQRFKFLPQLVYFGCGLCSGSWHLFSVLVAQWNTAEFHCYQL
jgi:hypothetical protein